MVVRFKSSKMTSSSQNIVAADKFLYKSICKQMQFNTWMGAAENYSGPTVTTQSVSWTTIILDGSIVLSHFPE